MVPDLADADKSGSFPILVPEVADELPWLYNERYVNAMIFIRDKILLTSRIDASYYYNGFKINTNINIETKDDCIEVVGHTRSD